MRKLFNYIAAGCLFCLLSVSFESQGHSVQVGYCVNCAGYLRIYVEHWHGAAVGTTTMDIELTINGVTTTVTGDPAGFISDTVKSDLPGCATPITTFGTCAATVLQCGANTCNYWVVYDFPNVQKGVPITIRILSGNNIFTEDGCSMFPATTPTFVIPLDVDPTAGTSQTICSGNSASISLANYTGSLQWQSSPTSGGPWTNIPGATTAPLSTGVLSTTTYYQAVVTGDCGSLTSNEVAITVGQPPSSNAGNDISTCPTNTPGNLGAPSTTGFSYSWSPGTGLNSTTVSNPTVTLTAPISTTYTVTTTSPGCASTTDEVTVTVTSLPTATVSGSATVCQGSAAAITFTGANGTAPYTFTYTINGGGNQTVVSTGNTATVNVTTSALGTVTYDLVSVQDASVITCSQLQTGTAVVTVNSPPVASISGTTTVCVNDPSPVITFTGSAGTAPYTFTYSVNGGANQTISTTVGNSVTINAPTGVSGTFTYAVTGIMDASAMACGSANINAVITVNPLPVSSITGTTSVCLNGPQPLITFTGLVGSPPFTFNYTLNGGAVQTISTTSGNTVTLSVPTNALGTFIYANGNASSTSCSNNGGDTAIVTVSPLPTASVAGTVTVCQNDVAPDITFTGTSGVAPFTFTYTVNGGANQTITTTTGNTVTLPAPTGTVGTFTYALVSVQDASCSNPANGNAVITVASSVIASISGTTNVCQNATLPDITFTGANGTAPYTFTYKINNGANQTINTTAGNSVTIQAPTGTAGTFVYDLVSISDAGTSTCYIATGSSTVTVNPLPTASVSGTATVCQNDPVSVITFTGANGLAPYTFTYNINGGANQTISTTAGTFVSLTQATNVSGTFTYSLVSVQESSSSACSQIQTGSAIVTVNPLPTATVSGTVAVCQNATSPDITFTGANGTAPYTFTYTINGGANQTINTTGGSSVTVPVPTNVSGTFTYALVSVSDASPTACSNTAVGNATVSVNPIPTASISGPPSVCQNSPAPIIFTGSSGVAPYTFTYTVNGGAPQTITTVSGNTITYLAPTNISGPFVYSLVSVQDGSAAACSSTVSGSAPVTITVNPLPTASIGPTASVCINDPQPKITFTGANGTAPYTFVYTVNGGAPQTISTIVGDTVSVAVPTNRVGTYTFAMVSLNDASAVACVNNASSTAVVTVNAKPSANFSVDPEIANTTDPNISVTDASSGASSWIWDFGDFDSAFVVDPRPHFYADTGKYTIRLTVVSPSGCVDTISHVVTIEVPYLFFIPNAFSPNGDGKNELFTVKGEGITEFSMMIFDRWGNFIFYSDDLDEGWDGKANLGSEVAQSDVYVYSIKIIDLKKKTHNYKGLVTLVK